MVVFIWFLRSVFSFGRSFLNRQINFVNNWYKDVGGRCGGATAHRSTATVQVAGGDFSLIAMLQGGEQHLANSLIMRIKSVAWRGMRLVRDYALRTSLCAYFLGNFSTLYS